MTNTRPTTLFPDGYRASGVVLDIAGLPSRYGIGDVGPSALSWVDQLRDAGQSWWQTIQLDSPRCADYGSSFAANTLLLSPDWLIEDGLLTATANASTSRKAQSITMPLCRSNIGFWKRPGRGSTRGSAKICVILTNNSERSRGTGWKTMRCFARSNRNIDKPITSNGHLIWSGEISLPSQTSVRSSPERSIKCGFQPSSYFGRRVG